MSRLTRLTIAYAAAAALVPTVARAHEAGDIAGGFFAGFMHPLGGPDHIVAMVAVGLWGGQLGRPAIWALPIVFPMVMAFGGALGAREVPVPFIEAGISISAIVLGAMVAFAARPALWIAGVIVGFFAIFHGYAHGAELPEAATPLAYGAGFVIATGMLHLTGVAVGLVWRWPVGKRVVRTCGVLVAAVGIYFLIAQIAGGN